MRGVFFAFFFFLLASPSFGQNIIGPDPSRTVLLVTPGFVPDGVSERKIVAEIWPSATPNGVPMWDEGPFDGSWFKSEPTSLPEDKLSVEKIVGQMRRPTGEPVDVKVLVTKVSTFIIPWPSEDIELVMTPKIKDQFMVRVQLINEFGVYDERYLNKFYLNVLGVAKVRIKDAFGRIPDNTTLVILFPAEYPISLTVSGTVSGISADRLPIRLKNVAH